MGFELGREPLATRGVIHLHALSFRVGPSAANQVSERVCPLARRYLDESISDCGSTPAISILNSYLIKGLTMGWCLLLPCADIASAFP